MSFKDRNALIEQSKEKVLNNEKITDKAVKEIMFVYDETAAKLETEIHALYQKFATDNKLTEAAASKLLSDKQYSVWRKSVEEYLKDIDSEGSGSKTLLELNTLAMKSRISVKEQLLSNVYRNMLDLAEDSTTKLESVLADIVKVNYVEGAFRVQSSLGIGFSVTRLSEDTIKEVLAYPWDTKRFSQSIWDKSDKIAAVAKHELSLGFASGSSVEKMAKSINDIMDKGKYAAQRLVRTECSYFSGKAELMSYQESGITRYRFLGGSEGSEHCACGALNGQTFDVDKAEVGVNYPPMHPNCKCTTVAVVGNSIFDERNDTEPLSDNIKLQEWQERYVGKEDAVPLPVKLSEAESHAINTYISSEAYKLNDKLRRGARLSLSDKKLIKNLDAALDKIPEYKGTVYRSVSDFGIDDVKGFVNSHKVGSTLTATSYLSSSTSVYDSSFPIQYVIKSRYGKDIRASNEREKEILFKRNTSFLITKIDGNTIYMEE